MNDKIGGHFEFAQFDPKIQDLKIKIRQYRLAGLSANGQISGIAFYSVDSFLDSMEEKCDRSLQKNAERLLFIGISFFSAQSFHLPLFNGGMTKTTKLDDEKHDK